MSALPQKKKFTPEEYLALEEKAEYRSEYENGEIVAMAGASLDYAQIASNVNRFVGNKIAANCRSLTTGVKVQVENYQKFYYSDVLVICGEPKFYQQRTDAITKPILIVEVLSSGTEAKDRSGKFEAHLTLETLQEYVLVSQDKAKVEQFTRQPGETWKYQATIGLRSSVKFTSIEVELTLEEIYQSVKLK